MYENKTVGSSITSPPPTTYRKRVCTVDEIHNILGINRTVVYDLVKQGCFRYIKVGRNYHISRESFDGWLGFQREVQTDK